MNENTSTWETKTIGMFRLAKFATKDENGKETQMISVVSNDNSWMLNVSEDLLIYHLLDSIKDGDEEDPGYLVLCNSYYVSILPDAKLHGKILIDLIELAKESKGEQK